MKIKETNNLTPMRNCVVSATVLQKAPLKLMCAIILHVFLTNVHTKDEKSQQNAVWIKPRLAFVTSKRTRVTMGEGAE